MGFFIDVRLIFGVSITSDQARTLAKQLKRCEHCLSKLVPIDAIYKCAEACEASGDEFYYDPDEADEKAVTDTTVYPNLYFGSANAWDKCGGEVILYVSMIDPDKKDVSFADMVEIYEKLREEFLRCLEFCGVTDDNARVIATYNSSC